MQWLAENWILVFLLAACLGMHLFGHRHGGHGSGDRAGRKPKDRDGGAEVPNAASGHRH